VRSNHTRDFSVYPVIFVGIRLVLELAGRLDQSEATHNEAEQAGAADIHVVSDFRIVLIAEAAVMVPMPLAVAVEISHRKGPENPPPEKIVGCSRTEHMKVTSLVHHV